MRLEVATTMKTNGRHLGESPSPREGIKTIHETHTKIKRGMKRLAKPIIRNWKRISKGTRKQIRNLKETLKSFAS